MQPPQHRSRKQKSNKQYKCKTPQNKSYPLKALPRITVIAEVTGHIDWTILQCLTWSDLDSFWSCTFSSQESPNVLGSSDTARKKKNSLKYKSTMYPKTKRISKSSTEKQNILKTLLGYPFVDSSFQVLAVDSLGIHFSHGTEARISAGICDILKLWLQQYLISECFTYIPFGKFVV